MTAFTLINTQTIRVNRTDLRDQQSKYLSEASGTTIVEVVGRGTEKERCIVDKQYLDELKKKLRALIETVEIMQDTKLFSQIMRAAPTLDEDARLGKLHSFEEAFGED